MLKRSDEWGMQTTDRHCALNLSNRNTIELRIFQGTLEYEEVMAYLEACHAASMFVKTFLKYNNFNVYNISDKRNKDNITNEFVQFVKQMNITKILMVVNCLKIQHMKIVQYQIQSQKNVMFAKKDII